MKNTNETQFPSKQWKDVLLSPAYQKFADEARRPLNTLMINYRCAMMIVETKFRVLNEQFSADSAYNPIKSIETRLKSILRSGKNRCGVKFQI